MSEFFNEKELSNLPPAERAELIKKKQKELEEQLKKEAERLEKKSLLELADNEKEIQNILEQEHLSLEHLNTLTEKTKELVKDVSEEVLQHNVDYSPNLEGVYSKNENIKDDSYIPNPSYISKDQNNFQSNKKEDEDDSTRIIY